MEVKPGYKHTELGVIPDEWEVGALATIADKIMVGIASAATHAYRVKGVPMFRNQNIKPGHLDDSDLLFIAPEYEVTFKNKRLRCGDLLTMRTGYPGVTAIVPAHYDSAQSFTTLITRPKQDEAESAYLCHFINSDLGQRFFTQSQIGGAQKNVNVGTLRKMPILLPPPPEQRAIAAALSDVDELLGGLDRLIAKKRELKRAAMQQLLTGQARLPGFRGAWELKRLGECAAFCAGTYLAQTEYRDGEYEVHGAGSVMGHNAEPNFRKAVSVVGRVGSVGRPRFMPNGCWVNNNAAAIVAREPRATPEFVNLLLLTVDWSKVTSVTAQPFLVVPALLSMEFAVPERAEQAAIAAVLSDMDAELAALEARRDKTRDIKQAMMQELLTGKTRLVNPEATHA